MTERVQRRLAAIVAADVAGYSRLLANDEAGTLAALRELRRDFFEPTVAKHRGEVIKRMGDGWIVQFSAVADAIAWAVAVQETMSQRSNIRLRMGAHLGDVTHEDEDIYGDGINIAARLQTLAEPGDLLISDDCARQLDARTTSSFENLGAQALKNIDRSMRAWRYRAGTASTEAVARLHTAPPYPTLLVAPLQAAGIAADFAPGLDAELAIALGHIRWIRIGDSLGNGHAYELSGVARAAGDRVRVTYALTDRTTGTRLLNRQVDADVTDSFLAQESISNEISAVVEHAVLHAESKSVQGQSNAWAEFLSGYIALNSGDTQLIEESITHFERSISGGFIIPRALSLLGIANVLRGHLIDHANRSAHFAAGANASERCLEMDPDDPTALSMSLFAVQLQGRVADSRIKARQLMRLAPSHPLAMTAAGSVLLWDHDYRGALALFNRAINCGRKGPLFSVYLQLRAAALYLLEEYAEAEITARECVLDFPSFSGGHRYLGLALAQLGRVDEARAELEIASRLGTVVRTQAANFLPDDIQERLLDGMRKAGMAEG